jgi:hypothetical protein
MEVHKAGERILQVVGMTVRSTNQARNEQTIGQTTQSSARTLSKSQRKCGWIKAVCAFTSFPINFELLFQPITNENNGAKKSKDSPNKIAM